MSTQLRGTLVFPPTQSSTIPPIYQQQQPSTPTIVVAPKSTQQQPSTMGPKKILMASDPSIVVDSQAPTEEKIYFIPGLFKPPSRVVVPVAENDPFIHLDILREHSSLFASDESGIPNYVSKDPNVSKIINFSDEVWNRIAKVQLQREKKDKAADKAESAVVKNQQEDKLKSTRSLDHKVDLCFKQQGFFLKKQCPVAIPYKSNLNHDEHETYLRAFVKFRMRASVTAADGLEFEMYSRLQNRVYEEQNCFMQFSQQVARAQLPAYNTVPDIVQNYVNEYVQHRCKRSSRYKRFYVHELQIPICPQDTTGRYSSLCFTHVGHLLSLGSINLMKPRRQYNAVILPLDESVSKHQPPAQDETSESKNTLFKTPVSEDQNAKYLATEYQANIVISSGALKILADNYGPSFDKEWDIPVKIESRQITDADGHESSFRTVYIDKPMPKKTWTPLEKKQLFYKKSALASLTEIRKLQFLKMKYPLIFNWERKDEECSDTRTRDDDGKRKYDDIFDLTSTADHDTFGVGLPSASRHSGGSRKNCTEEEEGGKQQKPECKKRNKTNSVEQNRNSLSSEDGQEPKNNEKGVYVDLNTSSEDVGTSKMKNNKAMKMRQSASPMKTRASNHQKFCSNAGSSKINSPIEPQEIRPSVSDSGNNVLEELLSMQDSLLKPTQTNSPTMKSEKCEASPTTPTKTPWSNTLNTNWPAHMQVQECPPWTGNNVHYQLFSFGFSSRKPSQSLQPLRIIVRHNIHGLSRNKQQKIPTKAYVIYPKLENQAFFGCEVNTWSEITHQWIQLLVRPNTSLLQVRVCESTGEVMMTEEKDLTTILKEGKQPHIAFSPHQPLATLYSVFSVMSTMSPGQYLLHHDPNTNAFIQLLRATQSDQEGHLQTFNLHSSYSASAPVSKQYSVPPWLAIDTHVLTPFHLKHFKIPATFPMKYPTNKKLSKAEKQKLKNKLKKKKRLDDLDKPNEREESKEEEDGMYFGRTRRQRKSFFSQEGDNMY
ncbi:little elongation complex subunit 2 [Procambarus clarkii]|uniref:little elongation complex subunit 2 n=1 Tax=Procambarus clarkii TaxID=6728 RepID=UPI001E673448|nr:little elongation complex subunit 2-like [Procambarus clarkii]